MNRIAKTAAIVIGALAPLTFANATEINLYVDSAPNVFGSPDWAPWWAAAQASASDGTFVNMASSSDPANAGTTCFEIEDVVVYSFGDLGSRLHFIYWVPDETIASLTAKNFELSLEYDWDGVTYDDYYGSTWITPSSWTEYNGGVIGSAGFAWWGAYLVNTPEALAADLAAWDPSQGDITVRARVAGEDVVSITACHEVPDGAATIVLLGMALCGLAFVRRRVG